MNVLFLCTGNSCRSQIAEAFGRRYVATGHRVWSAGISPQGINPRTMETMEEVGVSLDDQHSKDLDEVPVAELDLVVTLCGHAEENLPTQLEAIRREHWDLEDPADAKGDHESVKGVFRATRIDIEDRISQLFSA